jgi:hypothetical protein
LGLAYVRRLPLLCTFFLNIKFTVLGCPATNSVNQGKSLVFRVQCGDKVGYSLHQHPSKPDMVHSSLASLVRAATNFPQWSVVRR